MSESEVAKYSAKHEAEQAAAAMVQAVKESAMLCYLPDLAAQYCGITREAFDALLEDPRYAEAWRAGQYAVQESLHAALLEKAQGGSVGAIAQCLRMLQAQAEATPNADAVASEVLSPGASVSDMYRRACRPGESK